jgi:hypothetical protein
MADIEILAYTPNDMDKFIAFVIDGKRKPNGEHETDPDGREIVGVLRWLHGRGVPEAHFFNSAKGNDVQLFAATVQKPENEPDRPWMKEIPGFADMVKTDGLIGMTTNFAPIANLLASVLTNPDLDQRFVAGKTHVDTILESIRRNKDAFSFGEKEFLAALRGDVGSDSKAVFAEAEKTFKFSL